MTGSPAFLAAQAGGESWQAAAGQIVAALGRPGPEHRLGLIYAGPPFAAHLEEIEILLRQSTGVPHWAGTAGFGTLGREAGGEPGYSEHFNEPTLSVLLCPIPDEAFRIFSAVRGDTDRVSALHADWLGEAGPPAILAHGDVSNGLLGGLLTDLAEETDGFLLGGLSAAQGPGSQIADGPDGQGLSGVLLSLSRVGIQIALSQGCSPIGPLRTVTDGTRNVLIELDGRPALEVFKEDIGDVLSRDLRRCAGYIFAGLPEEGSDGGDYAVRALTAIDPENRALAIAAEVSPGDRILFCRRDPASAIEDMRRMLADLKRRLNGAQPRGALYVSCAARGPNQFHPPSRETDLIAEAFGDIPLTGFFANGEFCRQRLHTQTGVLTLFT